MAVPCLERRNSSRGPWWDGESQAGDPELGALLASPCTLLAAAGWLAVGDHRGSVSIPFVRWSRVRERPGTVPSASFQIRDQSSRGPFTVTGSCTLFPGLLSPPLITPYLLQSAASLATNTLRDGPPPVHGGDARRKGPPEAPMGVWPVLVTLTLSRPCHRPYPRPQLLSPAQSRCPSYLISPASSGFPAQVESFYFF